MFILYKNNILGRFLYSGYKNKKVHFTFISTDKAVEPKTVLGVIKE